MKIATVLSVGGLTTGRRGSRFWGHRQRRASSSTVTHKQLCHWTTRTTAAVLASHAEASAFTDKHGHKLLNGGTKHRIDIH